MPYKALHKDNDQQALTHRFLPNLKSVCLWRRNNACQVYRRKHISHPSSSAPAPVSTFLQVHSQDQQLQFTLSLSASRRLWKKSRQPSQHQNTRIFHSARAATNIADDLRNYSYYNPQA